MKKIYRMKKICRWSAGISLLTLAVLLSVAGAPKKSCAKAIKVQSVTKSKTRIQLKWKTKKKVSQIRIFRSEGKNHYIYARQQSKRIATLSGKKKSYISKVQKNKFYQYRIAGYQKKGKKYKKVCESIVVEFSGVAPGSWDISSDIDSKTTPSAIPLKVSMKSGIGFQPDGYQIYRSTDGKAFQPLVTIMHKKWVLNYTDKAVQSHQMYYYKVRAFKNINSTKCYGAFSEVEKHRAVNYKGKYTVKVLTEESDEVSALTVCLTSDAGNGELALGDTCMGSMDINGSQYINTCISKYSLDGENWYEWDAVMNKRMVVKPGQSIYLQFVQVVGPAEEERGKPFSYHTGGKKVSIEFYGEYNDFLCTFTIDLSQLTASAKIR